MRDDQGIGPDEDRELLEEDADPAEAPGDDGFEIEVDGQVHTLPAALKGAFLRQADYTRKTQELAGHRRAVEAERQALDSEREALHASAADRATLAALDRQLAAFQAVDWAALGEGDPRRAQALWGQAQETQALRDQFAYALSHHEAREELRAARAHADEMAATGRQLAQEIDGWSPDIAHKLVEYAQAFGVTLEELHQMADPRLWKLLHKAWRADQASQGEANAQALAMRPAVTLGSGGAGGSGVRDELGTKEWMRRRNAQMAGGR